MTVVLTTYDWVPEFPRGYVRDLRIRWVLEELHRPYRIATVPLRDKTATHLARQPFHQVPLLRDGEVELFETGAILLYLAKDTLLLPKDRYWQAVQWVMAALNSVEPFSMAWILAKVFDRDEAAAAKREPLLRQRLTQLQAGMADRDWLDGGDFTVADLLMADVLRVPAQQGLLDDLPLLSAYLARATSRPAFQKARDDHMAHWRAADAAQPQAAPH
ncbi:glutathione S-transferase family protein [Paracoccus sp. (in: a-proteobacteria)]|uniref:glutathione S-transferase family protein n=1 Tax=Paracoccus sp. TaxID=267 RepID=UPI00396C2F49